ncbi:MAG: hypothetical protein ACM3KD_00720 [Hyphomicrobiaceae bacterium]
MLDYVFFDDAQLRRFVVFLEDRQVPWDERTDQMAGRIVSIPEELADDVLDAVGERYDALLAEQSAAAEGNEDWVKKRVIGIQVSLSDGSLRTLQLDAATGNLLLERFTPEEAQQLVESIARSLENTAAGPLCHRE